MSTYGTAPVPEERLVGAAPPAEGIHGVVLSGRVHNRIAGTGVFEWADVETGAAVSGLLARDLTVVASDDSPLTGARHWHHERVAYRLVDRNITPPTVTVSNVPFTNAPEDGIRFDPTGAALLGGPLAHLTISALSVTRNRPPSGPVEVESVEVYGVALRYDNSGDAVLYFDGGANDALLVANPADPTTYPADTVSFTVRPEGYAVSLGDVDTLVAHTVGANPNAEVSFAHGLAGAPSSWEPAQWIPTTGASLVLPTRVDATHVHVSFPGVASAATGAVRLRARIA